MDKKDTAIIQRLQENSRASIRDIAKKTGIRPSTVHQRITRLKKEEIIDKFTIKLNNVKVGESLIVFMFVKTKPATQIASNVINDKHIKEIFGITGEYDLLIKLKFNDVTEFNDFIIQFRKEQQIETTHTMVVTTTIKEEI